MIDFNGGFNVFMTKIWMIVGIGDLFNFLLKDLIFDSLYFRK